MENVEETISILNDLWTNIRQFEVIKGSLDDVFIEVIEAIIMYNSYALVRRNIKVYFAIAQRFSFFFR